MFIPAPPVPKALCIIPERSLEYPLHGTKYQSALYLQMSPQKHTELREDLSFPFLMTPCVPSYSPCFPQLHAHYFCFQKAAFYPNCMSPSQLYWIPNSSMPNKSGHLAATQIVVYTATTTNSDFLLIPSAKVGMVTRDFLKPFRHSLSYVSLKKVCVLPWSCILQSIDENSASW